MEKRDRERRLLTLRESRSLRSRGGGASSPSLCSTLHFEAVFETLFVALFFGFFSFLLFFLFLRLLVLAGTDAILRREPQACERRGGTESRLLASAALFPSPRHTPSRLHHAPVHASGRSLRAG